MELCNQSLASAWFSVHEVEVGLSRLLTSAIFSGFSQCSVADRGDAFGFLCCYCCIVRVLVVMPPPLIQVAQLSQRDRAAGWVSNGQKWKTGTERQYLRTI